MNGITVTVESSPNEKQLGLITEAARMTQERGFAPRDWATLDDRLLGNLMSLGHTSCLEHADFAVTINGASRVFLSQIRTHRLASFTSASQQYQKHAGFAYLMLPFKDPELQEEYENFMDTADRLYDKIEQVMGRDWARYVLPGACRNILLLKANLREWFCTIIPLRACRRNTPETVHVISLILQAAVASGLAPLVRRSGPVCLTCGTCDQGKMSCGKPIKTWQEMLEVKA